MIGDPGQPLTWLGLPTDALGWGAGLCGVALLVPGLPRQLLRLFPAPSRLPLLALLAALLSAAYFQVLLGGRPRVIDASTYLLEARTFASGHFSFLGSESSALFRGRFLLQHPTDPTKLGPIFPPGYPAILSLAVRLGDYRVLGPILAAAITVSTAWLGLLVTQRRAVAILAATLSVLSAAVRYHTADTMSHGWSMLLTTLSLCMTVVLVRQASLSGASTSAFRAQRFAPSVLLGLCLGGLAATRPLTALAIGAGCLVPLALDWRSTVVRRAPARTGLVLLGLTIGLVPGLALLGAHNHALTGHVLGSPQLDYYALADGPPGCFRLGLGSGCRVEHGDVVQAQGGHGLTASWMLMNTIHRLHWHALDVANCELLLPLAWYWLARRWKKPATRALTSVVVLLPSAYALFYFQGSYPGGGARFFSELLPALQVALAAGLLALRWVHAGLALALLGYAGHAALVHTALPGAPPLQTTRSREGLSQVTSDHAFNLLFVPGRIESGQPPTVIRATNDARSLVPRGPPIRAVLEAEADWPLRRQQGVWTERVHLPSPCVSGGQALRLHALTGAASEEAFVELELTGIPRGRYSVVAWVWSAAHGCRPVRLGETTLPRRRRLLLAELGPAPPGEALDLDRLELSPAE